MLNAWTIYNGCHTFTTNSGINFSICPNKQWTDYKNYEDTFVVYMGIDEMGKFGSLEEAQQFCLEMEPEVMLNKVKIDLERVNKPVRTIIYHFYRSVPKNLFDDFM